MAITIFKLRSRRDGKHVEQRVFVGPDLEHLALAGTLRWAIGEWQLFGATLLAGEDVTGRDARILLEGSRDVVEAFRDDG